MTEREIFQQLNSLKGIGPESGWKERTRQTLINQISAGQADAFAVSRSSGWIRLFIGYIGQPAGVVLIVVCALAAGASGSYVASRDTKPGDSLYIAKIISETTREKLTFNETEKTKLHLEFASNRAKEITQVLSEANQPATEKASKVEKLANNFKEEITTIKNNLAKIKPAKSPASRIADSAAKVPISVNGKKNNNKATSSKPNDKSGNEELYTANLGKDSKGIEISGQKVDNTNNPSAILDEAEKLFNAKDYKGTVSKLEEASDVIQKIDDKGEVKGTSTSIK